MDLLIPPNGGSTRYVHPNSAQKALGFEETDSSCAVIVGTVNASRYQQKTDISV